MEDGLEEADCATEAIEPLAGCESLEIRITRLSGASMTMYLEVPGLRLNPNSLEPDMHLSDSIIPQVAAFSNL